MQEKGTGDLKNKTKQQQQLKEFSSKPILTFFTTMVVSRMKMKVIILGINFLVHEGRIKFNCITAVKERRCGVSRA